VTTAEQSTFQNEDLQVSLKKESGCKIILDVFVTPKATKESYSKAIDAVKKEISIPGFRKGKAPNSLVLQNYGKYVEKEWKDILLDSSFDGAVKLIKIYPFGQKSVKAASIKSASKEDGSTLSFEFESAPNVPDVEPETLSIPEVKFREVTQKDIDETIQKLSNDQGDWTDITDRSAQDGDFVIIDIDNIDEVNPGNLCTNQLFELKKGKMANWMHKLIVGMIPGQTAEGVSEKKDNHEECKECEDGTHVHPNFIPALCRITLHTIRHVKPHPLDDELAKKYGAQNFQTLIERVKSSLENQAKEEKIAQERRFMEDELFIKYPFDIPASLITEELKLLRTRLNAQLRQEGLEGDKLKEEAKRIELEAVQKYARDFALYFLTQKYAQQNNIVATPDEVSMEVMRALWMARMGQSPIDPESDPKELQAQIKLQILAGKAVNQMIEKATKMPKKA
jgi:trigger factor